MCCRRCLNKYMTFALLLQNLGLGFGRSGHASKGQNSTVLGKPAARRSPQAVEREKFEDDVREQFKQLKKKGLSIPVFTL
jgi:hypothetical protein